MADNTDNTDIRKVTIGPKEHALKAHVCWLRVLYGSLTLVAFVSVLLFLYWGNLIFLL